MSAKQNSAFTRPDAFGELYDPGNPFAIGRREYDDRYERLAKNAASWRRVAFLMLLLLSASVAVVLWMAQGVKVVPYVVQVDEHGYEIAVRPAEAAPGVDDRVVMARVADFVTDTRSVCADAPALMRLIDRAYATLDAASPAAGKLDSWFRETNPFVRAKQDTVVDVTLQSVLRASDSGKTWQAEWSEKTWERGQPKGEHFYKGLFEVAFHSPTKVADVLRNPLGVFVSDFHITEKLTGPAPVLSERSENP